ncbi:MAG: hypothetical protein R3E39_27165 [Anaerolineae bacterium]
MALLLAQSADYANLPLHWQAGTRERTAEMTESAGGTLGCCRCNVASAAVGSLSAAAVQKYRVMSAEYRGKAKPFEPLRRRENTESWVDR